MYSNHTTKYITPLITSGVILLSDQFLKYFARTHQAFTYYVGTKWLGWEYLANTGVAFSIPLPSLIAILTTPFIIAILLIAWHRNRDKKRLFHFGMALIIFGAVSNFIDRLAFGFTIDYLRVFTGVINLADVMIVGGMVLLLIHSQSKISSPHTTMHP